MHKTEITVYYGIISSTAFALSALFLQILFFILVPSGEYFFKADLLGHISLVFSPEECAHLLPNYCRENHSYETKSI